MAEIAPVGRLDRPVDELYDHVLGPEDAEITLVEYGSYDCSHCRAANERIAVVRNRFGDRLRYVFRHRPLTGSKLAQQAAELVESGDPNKFWDAHVSLMTRSSRLTEDDLVSVAKQLNIPEKEEERTSTVVEHAKDRVADDMESARASGVMYTPTFFINGRRYEGPWDETSLSEAMLGSLGHRVRTVALDFASWAPSSGLLLLIASIIAVVLTNSAFGPGMEALWHQTVGLVAGRFRFEMPLREWVNHGLLTIFFLVVGLEIKREFTVGRLASRRSAALPIAGAIGGMVVPALIYILLIPSGAWSHGWGVPIATDTAFAVALIAMLGTRVPVELRIFLTAAAIVDDIGAISVVAMFYSGDINFIYLGVAVLIICALALLNRASVYRVLPYLVLGLALWFCVYQGGLHATLAGVIFAIFIPTLPPTNLRTLMIQADSIVAAEAKRSDQVLREGPSLPALRALDAIHDRIESPADRMLRTVEPWSSYVVLPVFALANAGVLLRLDILRGHEWLMAAIGGGLLIGKPVGMVLVSFLAVKLGVAVKPSEYSWRQLIGAGALAGIGFTMSLFIAGQAFRNPSDFAAAKIAVFSASVISAIIGVAILFHSAPPQEGELKSEPDPELETAPDLDLDLEPENSR